MTSEIDEMLAEKATAEMMGMQIWKRNATQEWGHQAALDFARNQKAMWGVVISEIEQEIVAAGGAN